MLAAQGGTSDQTPAQLTELASDARSQAQLYRDADSAPEPAQAATVAADQGRATAERSDGQLKYDSAERREATANELKSHGIPQETINVRMRADIAQGRPASEAAAPQAHVKVPNTNRGRGQDRSAGRTERSR